MHTLKGDINKVRVWVERVQASLWQTQNDLVTETGVLLSKKCNEQKK